MPLDIGPMENPRLANSLLASAAGYTLAQALAAYDAAVAGSNEFTMEDAAHMLAAAARRPKASRKAARAPAGLFTPENFSAALKRAAGAIERRNSIPILSNVLLQVEAGRLTITGTDLDAVISTTLTACPWPDFTLTVEPRQLMGLIKGAAEVTLEPVVQPAVGVKPATVTQVVVITDGSRAQLPCIDAGDFPVMLPKLESVAMWDAAALRDGLAFVSCAISTEETRYYLNGVHLNTRDAAGRAILRFETTDGHRAMVQTSEAPAWDGPIPDGILIPRKSVGLLVGLLPTDGDVMVEVSASHIRVTLPDGVFTSKQIDGSFPDIWRVIPHPGEAVTTARVEDPKAFSAAVSRLITISAERSRSIQLTIAGEVEGVVRNMEGARVVGALPAVGEGEGFECGLNARYLVEFMTAPCLLKCYGENSPLRIEYDDRPDRVAVLMPLRV